MAPNVKPAPDGKMTVVTTFDVPIADIEHDAFTGTVVFPMGGKIVGCYVVQETSKIVQLRNTKADKGGTFARVCVQHDPRVEGYDQHVIAVAENVAVPVESPPKDDMIRRLELATVVGHPRTGTAIAIFLVHHELVEGSKPA